MHEDLPQGSLDREHSNRLLRLAPEKKKRFCIWLVEYLCKLRSSAQLQDEKEGGRIATLKMAGVLNYKITRLANCKIPT
jgi:hypothetical protein